MELIEWILEDRNLTEAIKAVKSNKGAPGVDKMPVEKLDGYFREHGEEIKESIRNKKYKPSPVRRVYIPKANGKQRPLGIPTVVDRVIQQAVAQILMKGYERYFSENSYGFRPGRSAQQAIEKALSYLNEGCEWVIDLDIEKYFDTVNHDRLISILRERINDAPTLHLIRSFLRAGVMEDGLVSPSEEGVPQGGPLSPVLSNVYLDKLDKELESRGLRFVRYADDCNIFVKSEMAADRVMASITDWLERKLRLKVNATKTKVVRPTKSNFLGFTFYKNGDSWKCMPAKASKAKLYAKTKEILCRKKAAARKLGITFQQLNWLIRGWVNYFRIGGMKSFLEEYSAWMRHKVRVVILKQWKRPRTIYRNLEKLNRIVGCNFTREDIYKVANSRLGWYRRSAGYVMSYALNPTVLGTKTKDRPGLVDPLGYYLRTT
ncbi:MAG: group II intron reverse transcriptase/maturase [Oscillospiraceae bacterium]|nr:group II intron reverse transcriptase/maturase [Oscillospiraceae bacterium]